MDLSSLSNLLNIKRNNTTRAICTSIGLGLLGEGVRRRGVLGTVEILLGAGLTWEGLSESGVAGLFGGNKDQDPSQSPSYVTSDHAPASTQTPRDNVDEALMESFPASDPPAYSAMRR